MCLCLRAQECPGNLPAVCAKFPKWGIEANPEKIKAITSPAKRAYTNDVQRLAGQIAALS